MTALRDYLESRLELDVHQHHSARMVLGGCSCHITTPKRVVIGDFIYHYSDQLDAFSLWEIMEVDREKEICKVRLIDGDETELGTSVTEHPLKKGYNKFYHPDPEDRAIVERKGFESQYIPLFFTGHNPRRQLFLKLSPTPVSKWLNWLKTKFHNLMGSKNACKNETK